MARQMTDAFRVKCAVLLVLGVSSCGKPSSVETPPASCVVPDTGLPFDVFCTGLYADGSADAYSADVMPYTPILATLGYVFSPDGDSEQVGGVFGGTPTPTAGFPTSGYGAMC